MVLDHLLPSSIFSRIGWETFSAYPVTLRRLIAAFGAAFVV
jgi:hypothetical protein